MLNTKYFFLAVRENIKFMVSNQLLLMINKTESERKTKHQKVKYGDRDGGVFRQIFNLS